MSVRVPRVATMAAIALATVAAGPRAVSAGGFGIPEIGVRRTGMGAVIGRPDDPSAVYHNPAGLILQPGTGLYISAGLSLLDTEFRLRPWGRSDELLGAMPQADGYYAPVRPSRAMGVIPMIAATYEILPTRLVVGASVYVGNATGAAFHDDAVTRYHLIDGYVVAPQAVLAAAYRLAPSLTVGATAGVIQLRVHGVRELYPIFNGTDLTSYFGEHSRLQLDGKGWAPTWMVGLYGQPHPRVTWGATVTGRVDAELKGPLKITLSDELPDHGMTLDGTQTTKQLLPWAFMGGVNVDVTDHVELGGELRYWLYRQYDEQRTAVQGIGIVNELVTVKNYRDSYEVSGGVRVHDLDFAPALDLMAGAQYDRSPAPARSVTLDQPSFSHPALHSGLRYRFGRYRVGASYIHYWYRIPTIEDSITTPPSNIRGHGGNNIFTLSLEASL